MSLNASEPVPLAIAPTAASAPLAPAPPVGASDAVSADAPTGISVHVSQEMPPPRSLKLAGLAAFFGLQQRRRTEKQAIAPHDDPYAAYLRWSDGSLSALDDRESPAA